MPTSVGAPTRSSPGGNRYYRGRNRVRRTGATEVVGVEAKPVSYESQLYQLATGLLTDEERHAVKDCSICCEPMSLAAIGHCRDAICWLCCLKLRAKKHDRNCPFCKAELGLVLIIKNTFELKRVSESKCNEKSGPMLIPDVEAIIASRDSELWDKQLGVVYDNFQIKEVASCLTKFICWNPSCAPDLTNISSYKTFSCSREWLNHCQQVHNAVPCKICLRGRTVFDCEQLIFSQNHLGKHIRFGDKTSIPPIDPHVKCKCCGQYQFDVEAYCKHVRDVHFSCYICDARGFEGDWNSFPPVFTAYHELVDHYSNEHFFCHNCHSVCTTSSELLTHQRRNCQTFQIVGAVTNSSMRQANVVTGARRSPLRQHSQMPQQLVSGSAGVSTERRQQPNNTATDRSTIEGPGPKLSHDTSRENPDASVAFSSCSSAARPPVETQSTHRQGPYWVLPREAAAFELLNRLLTLLNAIRPPVMSESTSQMLPQKDPRLNHALSDIFANSGSGTQLNESQFLVDAALYGSNDISPSNAIEKLLSTLCQASSQLLERTQFPPQGRPWQQYFPLLDAVHEIVLMTVRSSTRQSPLLVRLQELRNIAGRKLRPSFRRADDQGLGQLSAALAEYNLETVASDAVPTTSSAARSLQSSSTAVSIEPPSETEHPTSLQRSYPSVPLDLKLEASDNFLSALRCAAEVFIVTARLVDNFANGIPEVKLPSKVLRNLMTCDKVQLQSLQNLMGDAESLMSGRSIEQVLSLRATYHLLMKVPSDSRDKDWGVRCSNIFCTMSSPELIFLWQYVNKSLELLPSAVLREEFPELPTGDPSRRGSFAVSSRCSRGYTTRGGAAQTCLGGRSRAALNSRNFEINFPSLGGLETTGTTCTPTMAQPQRGVIRNRQISRRVNDGASISRGHGGGSWPILDRSSGALAAPTTSRQLPSNSIPDASQPIVWGQPAPQLQCLSAPKSVDRDTAIASGGCFTEFSSTLANDPLSSSSSSQFVSSVWTPQPNVTAASATTTTSYSSLRDKQSAQSIRSQSSTPATTEGNFYPTRKFSVSETSPALAPSVTTYATSFPSLPSSRDTAVVSDSIEPSWKASNGQRGRPTARRPPVLTSAGVSGAVSSLSSVICHRCNVDNRAWHRFCRGCAAALRSPSYLNRTSTRE